MKVRKKQLDVLSSYHTVIVVVVDVEDDFASSWQVGDEERAETVDELLLW